jgi:hypothetical protein
MRLKPSYTDAINLASVHEHIRIQFGPLFLRQRYQEPFVPLYEVDRFLHLFFVQNERPVTKEIRCHFYIEIRKYGHSPVERKMDILQLVSVQKAFPLLTFECWGGPGMSRVFTNCMARDIDRAVRHWKKMDAQRAEKIKAVELEIYIPEDKGDSHKYAWVFLNPTVKKGSEREEEDGDELDRLDRELGFPAHRRTDETMRASMSLLRRPLLIQLRSSP